MDFLRRIASMRLRERMMLLIALAGLPGIAIAVYLAASWLQTETEQIEVSVDRLARLAAARQDTVIEISRVVVAAVAQRYRNDDPSLSGCREYLAGWLDQVPALTSLSLYDRQGLRLCTTDQAELPREAGGADWFGEVQEATGFVLGGYTFGESGQPLLVAAYPVLRDDGQFSGAVGLGIDLHWLDFLSQTIELPSDTTVTAIASDGDILFHNAVGPGESETDVGTIPSRSALSRMAVMTGGTLRAENQADSPRVYGVQQTRFGDIVVAVGHTPYLDYARYWDALLNTLMAPLIVLGLALIVAGYASEVLVARTVRSLTRTVEKIEGGDLSARTGIPYSQYELGRLARAFDRMAGSIEEDRAKLENLVVERETLIRELNHRVKNNLQIVLSMLRNAMAGSSDPMARERLETLAGRVQNLAQVHELLYQRYDSEVPKLDSFVTELSGLLGEFYEEDVGAAEIEGQIHDLDIGQCISFGLILNELVANAHKHAFDDGGRGRISIKVIGEEREGTPHVHLIVADDGKGLPAGFDLDAGSTGSRLMRGLTGQLRGEIWAERLPQGTAMHVRFPVQGSS